MPWLKLGNAQVIFPYFQNCVCCARYLKNNEPSIWCKKYAVIIMLGHYLCLKVWGKLFSSQNRLCLQTNIWAYFSMEIVYFKEAGAKPMAPTRLSFRTLKWLWRKLILALFLARCVAVVFNVRIVEGELLEM